jgi:hypothetical protein
MNHEDCRMSESNVQLKEELQSIAHGLWRISPDCVRVLSTHEAEEVVQELRARVDRVLAQFEQA